MESNYHEDQSNSSTDDQEIDQENNDLGVGRSYECVFCKRGFNTAQALGGHMNIHRKDRARKKPMTTSHSNKEDETYTGPRLYQRTRASSYCNNNIQISAGGHRFDQSHNDHQANLSYATYFPASSSIARSDESDRDHPQPLDPAIRGDWSMSLDLELSQRIVEDLDRETQVMNQKEELDLELRLGYD